MTTTQNQATIAALNAARQHIQGEALPTKAQALDIINRALGLAALQAAPAPGSIDTPEFHKLLLTWEAAMHPHSASALRNLIAHIDAHVAQRAARPVLAVWYGAMPESNGKSNFTAILHSGDVTHGITLDVSEYPDRVRYEADRARFLIGDLPEEPFILDYDADKHSGYVDQRAASAGDVAGEKRPVGWTDADEKQLNDGVQKTADEFFPKASADEVAGDTVAWLVTLPGGELELGAAYFDKDEADDYIENHAIEGCYLTELIVRPPAPKARAPDAPAGDLPPLPRAVAKFGPDSTVGEHFVYTADQMRAYVLADRAARQPDADELHFNAQRLRNVGKLVGLSIDGDDAMVDGCRGTWLGQIADVLRERAAVAPAGHAEPVAGGAALSGLLEELERPIWYAPDQGWSRAIDAVGAEIKKRIAAPVAAEPAPAVPAGSKAAVLIPFVDDVLRCGGTDE